MSGCAHSKLSNRVLIKIINALVVRVHNFPAGSEEITYNICAFSALYRFTVVS
jgi:hypothetical protein